MLASLLYPYDDDAKDLIDGWMNELDWATTGIRRYDVDGSAYLEITKWREHQKIDRPTASRLPPNQDAFSKPREKSSRSRQVSRTLDLVSGPRDVAEGEF